MLSEIRQTEKEILYDIMYMQNLEKVDSDKEYSGGYYWLRGEESGTILVKEYKHSAIRWTCSKNPTYDMIIMANNTILYTWKLGKKVNSNVFITHKKMVNVWCGGGVS